MRGFTLLLLAPLALASAVLKRDAQSVYDDITAIDTNVRKLTAALTAYNGGIRETQPTFDASIAVHYVNREGFRHAYESASFSSADSKRIVDHVNDSVGVSIPAGLQVLEAKKPLFDDAQVSSLVKAAVDLLKYDHETFSAVVGTKLSLDQTAPGLAAAGKIDAALQAASLYYTV
ncbi:hypothetical protein K431DRAFT_285943 [Polychaeton citri CBS 116435]|uniref:Uncharacterized protein n=1 Tax=Polychaeton citri CBS 116435 TaxID=1314669 RepID=A0A9P4Q908_9PEZI|nr:hypothetical protein K431DRAFT_285943 [Polychaeton citri CBS 116435]